MKHPLLDPIAQADLLRRRRLLGLAPLLLLGMGGGARAQQERSAMEKIRDRGTLTVALYKDNAPYSDGSATGMQGLDVSLAQALATQLQLKLALLPFDAGEDMGDDLRNMVWRGHYLGYGPADVMLHVPVDTYFMGQNRQALIFGAYAREHLVVLHRPQTPLQVNNPEDLVGFKLAAERGTGAASALMGYRGGLLREQVAIYKSGMDAARAVLSRQADAAFISLAQAESAVFQAGLDKKDWVYARLTLPGVPPNGWPLGMAVKASNRELATALDTALDALRKSGELLNIFRQQGLTLAAP